ncbi:FtsX-like permease family protein [Blastococcus xanthinilyticus]|uniref:Putative ABC transport system permease protein n=1 Tax=Blastococcus xanthinilyticus TaxID=1564164 RepID=A0A5S5CWZ4_9ACTN|nr:ABC transporter permease [Blastococcus xanthinilyticus]TYP86879.1 putative ABC transport system permease protein [Blastococcus xanthinilyticus]
MSAVFALAVRMTRSRLAALVAVVCAVLGGAAIVTGTGVLAESGLRSELPAGRLAGADVLVSADQTVRQAEDLPVALPERVGVPADLADRLAGIPGVVAAAGDLAFPAAVLTAGGDVVAADDPAAAGHGWSSLQLLPDRQVEGSPPTGPGEVAVDPALAAAAGLGPGDTTRVVAAGRTAEYRVTAVAGPARAGLLFADDVAAALAGRTGTVHLIGLRIEPGTADRVADAVRAEVAGSDLVVATGADRGALVLPEAAAARSLLVVLASSLAGVPLLVVGFVIAGALSVSIAGQRRELALLRAVGTTPRQVRGLVASQATLAAAVALVPGIALGYLLADRFRRLLVGIGLVPEQLPLTWSPLPALAAALLLLLVVQVAARSAAWRVSRAPVTAALGESRTGPAVPSAVRTRIGLGLLVAAVPLALLPLLLRSQMGAAGTSLAGIVGAIGLALAGPVLLRRVTGGLARRLPSGASAPTCLAVANLHGYALRSAGAVTTLAMAVVLALTYTSAHTTVAAAVSGEAEEATLATAQVTAPALGGIPDDALATVRAAAGVEAAVPVRTTAVLWSESMLGEVTVETEPALVLPPAASEVLDLDVRAGSLAGLTGDTVALGAEAARARDAGVGSRVRLTLGDGAEVPARVVAVYDRALGLGSVVLSPDLAAGHTTSDLADQLLVRTDGSAGADRALAAAVAARPGLVLADADAGPARGVPPETWVNLAVVGVLLGYVLLGVANSLVAATAQRREELATLRLSGTTPAQLRAMVRWEAGFISAAAVLAGVLVSAVPLALLGAGFLGRPWPAGPWWLLPASAAVVTALAFAAIGLTTRTALRTPPTVALAGAA